MRILLILTILLGVLTVTPTQAMVKPGEIQKINLKLVYPVVYTENKQAENKINKDISAMVHKMKNAYDNGKLYTASMSYDVTYEDADVVSIMLTRDSISNPTAVHGYYWREGIVYNKKTGERIPLYNYVRIKDAEQLMYGLYGNVINEFTQSGKRVWYFHDNTWKIKSVSESYVLLGRGKIALLYPPYAAGPYADGTISIEFDEKAVDYYNRMNRE